MMRLIYVLLVISSFCFSFEGWTHLELGAGNYGPDGHTRASQAKTVLMKLKEFTSAPNYIDELEEAGRCDYKPEEQYAVLFWTLDELVNRYGETGVFHVNDLYEEYAEFATQKLKEYAKAKGYHSVIIETISGDYQFLNAEKKLSQYGKKKYQSVHLKNPEISFYHDTMDGNDLFASDESRLETRMLLSQLANLSEEGLYLFLIYHDNFTSVKEREEYMEKNLFYHQTDKWEPVPYIFPEGDVFKRELCKVFFIRGGF